MGTPRPAPALDRTQPMLPVRSGLPARRTRGYVRHGTTTPFAALEVAAVTVTDTCYPRHRHRESLTFLKQVARAYPRVPLHVVGDNDAPYRHPAVRAWLQRNPRITLHFTPTSASWLNLVDGHRTRSDPARRRSACGRAAAVTRRLAAPGVLAGGSAGGAVPR